MENERLRRRDFLKAGLAGGLVWGLARGEGWGGSSPIDREVLRGLRPWDAHAHPHSFFSDRPDATTPTLSLMKAVGLAGCVFSAVGDRVYNLRGGARAGSPKFDTARQLDRVQGWARDGEIRLIQRPADLDRLPAGEIGAIIGIEGGDALEGNLENLDYFYAEYAVRLITLMHDRTNEIGGHQRAPLQDQGLTPFGRQLVQQMNQRGVIIDVAHANSSTLKDITSLTVKPVVDSHTSLAPPETPPGRFRSWPEMELVVKTGGLVCTWPLAYAGRQTLADWAREILTMKKRLGLTHVGLGTDGGGRLPRTVEGFRNIGDLPQLVRALGEAGLSRAEIQAYLGGNLERVIRDGLVQASPG
ncbi:MAG: membrane dipeptidase [Deltaproteobacteria bacterium]|nr:membrane dipeptidase [Deltaproteobacteria bacterium]